jgi:hypothetical protein
MGLQTINKVTIIVFLAFFWTIVYTLFVFAGQTISAPAVISNADMTSLQNQALNSGLSKPNPMTFMFEVMFFQVPPEYGIPMFVSLMLLMIGGLSVFVIAGILLGKLIDSN